MKHRALGLDMASATGWAVMQRGGPHIFDTWNARFTGDYGHLYAKLFAWLGQMRQVHGFEAIGYETPWLNPEGDTMHKLRILHGFPVVAATFAGIHKMPCIEVGARDAKKALTGNSYAKKHEMVLAARRLGWKVKNDDEADAGAVGMCVIEQVWPSQ